MAPTPQPTYAITTTTLKNLRVRPYLHQLDNCQGDPKANTTDALENIEFDDTTSVDGYEIGWIKLIECTEENPHKDTHGHFTIRDGYTMDEIEDLLPYVISMRISPPGNAQTNANYTDFVLETVPCSNPVFAINNKKEMTWRLNPFTYKVDHDDYYLYNLADTTSWNYRTSWSTYESNDWIGSSEAKQRLRTDGECPLYLENGDPRDFPDLYHSCSIPIHYLGDGFLHIDVNQNRCSWDKEKNYRQDIHVYFGFDQHKQSVCEPELDEINVTYSDNFIFVPYLSPGLQAEMFCEQIFNTSLAIVNTEQKKDEAFVLRYEAGYHHHNVRIGLVKPLFSDWHWQRTANLCDQPGCDVSLDTYDWLSYCGSLAANKYTNSYDECEEPEYFLCDRLNSPYDNEFELMSCDFSIKQEIKVTRGFEIFNHNISIGRSMSILFDIKLEPHFVCKAIRCNIFHIGDELSTKLPSMYIVKDDIEIYMFNYHGADRSKHTIVNAAKLLCDGEYHRIQFTLSHKDVYGEWGGERRLLIDNITYLWSSSEDHISDYSDYDYKAFVGNTYPLFISNPWEESVDAMIKHFCIETNFNSQILRWTFVEKVDVYHEFDIVAVSGFNMNKYPLPFAYHDEAITVITSFEMYQRELTARNLAVLATDCTQYAQKQTQNIYKWGSADYINAPTYNYTADHNCTGLISSIAEFKEYIPSENKVAWIMYSQQWIQHEEKLYILMDNSTNSSSYAYSKIYIFDLNKLDLESISIIPPQYYPNYLDFALDSCITTNHSHLFIINQGIIIYDIASNSYIESSISATFTLSLVGCAVYDDHIYIFGGSSPDGIIQNTVYEYDIIHDTIQVLDEIQLNPPMFKLRAITTGNHKIYLYGGSTGIRNDTTLRPIFDAKSKTFAKSRFVDNGKDLVFATATYDPETNLILRCISKWNQTKDRIELLVVDPTAIDFTVTDVALWRSDVLIDYILNDYTLKTDLTLYKFQFDYTNSTDNVTHIMMIDHDSLSTKASDICYVCPGVEWSDDECDSSCSIHVYDPAIHSININIQSINYNVQILFSDSLFIEFNTCEITYDITPDIEDKLKVYIVQFDDVCYSNPLLANGGAYVANIYNKEMGINHDIIATSQTNCKICKFNDCTHTINCSDGIMPVLSKEQENEPISFVVIMTSSTTDLETYPPSFALTVGTLDELTLVEKGSIAFASVFACCILMAALYFYSQSKKLKADKERYKHDIYNPLCVMIGVGTYDTYTMDIEQRGDGLRNVYCADLFGIEHDYLNMKTLCKVLNYDLIPMSDAPKVRWAQHEIMDLLRESAEKANNSLDTDNPYDSMLVVCSGHGLNNQIITSDYQSISKDAIHRLYSVNYPNLREIPRIFIFDVCDGSEERSYLPSTYDEDAEDDEGILADTITEQGKNLEVTDHLEKRQSTEVAAGVTDQGKNVKPEDVVNDEKQKKDIWSADQHNPDFKLVTIHAANLGFKAKMDCTFGSYLTKTFVDKMHGNFNQKTKLFFGEIMDNLQNELHKAGKQQTVNTFNNHTRYLRFQKRTNDSDKSERNASGVIEEQAAVNVNDGDGEMKQIEMEPVDPDIIYDTNKSSDVDEDEKQKKPKEMQQEVKKPKKMFYGDVLESIYGEKY
eukprot:192737_1